ncbi:MAG: hypothetical protein WC900_00585 [Oscillospiraceae bacterium]|jgi:hypothetical protein
MKNTVNLTKTAGLLTKSNINFKEVVSTGTGLAYKNRRDEITLDTDILDTINTDFDSFINTVFIPIKTEKAENTFKWFFGDEYDNDFLTLDSLFLVIKPIEGHNINAFDGQYDYFIVSSSLFKLTNDIVRAGKQITDISEEEKVFIQRILWGHRPVTNSYLFMAESLLSEQYPDIRFERFAGDVGHDYCKGEWHGVFKTSDDRFLIARTKDTKSNKPEFEFKFVG